MAKRLDSACIGSNAVSQHKVIAAADEYTAETARDHVAGAGVSSTDGVATACQTWSLPNAHADAAASLLGNSS